MLDNLTPSKKIGLGVVSMTAVIVGSTANLANGFFSRPEDYKGLYFPTGPDTAGILNLGSLILCGLGVAILVYLACNNKSAAGTQAAAQNSDLSSVPNGGGIN